MSNENKAIKSKRMVYLIMALLMVLPLTLFLSGQAASQDTPILQVEKTHGQDAPAPGKGIIRGTGFANLTYGHVLMLLLGMGLIYLGIGKEYAPLLLIPIGFGILLGNIPLPVKVFDSVSVYMIDPVSGQYLFNTTGHSILGLLYAGITSGIFPPLLLLGLGAITDFSPLLTHPKSLLLGVAGQVGIFLTLAGALWLGFVPADAAAIGMIGSADGPSALFLAAKLAPTLLPAIALAAFLYMALGPILQRGVMKLITTSKERKIRMAPGRKPGDREKIYFPLAGLLTTCLVAPGALPLLGMFFLGNLLKESGVTARLAKTAASALIDVVTILLGVAIGAAASAPVILHKHTAYILVLGACALVLATLFGILAGRVLNLFCREKINPLIGAAGISAFPDAARVAHQLAQEEDPGNALLPYAMGPNLASLIGSAMAAGVFFGLF